MRISSGASLSRPCGTVGPPFRQRPPQDIKSANIFLTKDQSQPYSNKCDVWSLGCVLYELAALKPPFVSHDLKSLKKTIISGVYKRIPVHYSDELEALIRLCLKVDPKDRPSAAELLDNDLLKKKTGGMSESACMNSSSLTRKLLL
ncbi:uncharacterized protein LOC116245007 [Nymphaea colorata]|uniref:uncharacterized protein LOC116245007 n=1 Tax=Nymphaea colorata TaxID=210225 RepID=UPI00129E3CC2|nr:uncharacterized protein LOC116245007 [Nymphaea colorata]